MPALIGQGVIVNDRSSSGGGTVNSVTGNIVDNTDPVNPVVTQQQADWKETNPVAIPYIDNKPYYTTTRANLLTDMAANALVLDAGYLITDADPTVANSGIIVRATGPGRVSREAVFLANYGGTIYSEFCLYDVTNDKVKERRDIYGNTVIDSTSTHGTLQAFPWGNNKVIGNTIKDTTLAGTGIGSGELQYNIMESGQLVMNDPTTIKNNVFTGPFIITVGNNCTMLGNTIHYINTLTLNNSNIMIGCGLRGAQINVTLDNLSNAYNCTITGSSTFTIPNGRTLTGQFHNLIDTDLSRYAIGTFNNATYIGNVNSNFEITIDLGGTSSFSDTTINAPGVVICSNAALGIVDDVVLGNITTPVIFRYQGIAVFTLDSGNPGQFTIDNNIKNNTLLGSGIITMDNTKGCYFIARWSQSQSAWIIESFYSL